MKSSTFGLGLMVQLIRKLFQSYIKLEVIIDCGSALVTYRKEIESKGVQFPGQDAPDNINRGG